MVQSNLAALTSFLSALSVRLEIRHWLCWLWLLNRKQSVNQRKKKEGPPIKELKKCTCHWLWFNIAIWEHQCSWNSSSLEAKPGWKAWRGFDSRWKPLLGKPQLAVEFFLYLIRMNSRSSWKLIDNSALSEATCIRYIGHQLMIPYTGEVIGLCEGR